MSFVSDFLEYTKSCESPTSYFKWTAFTILAAALRDNCYIVLPQGIVYPNIYTILLSQASSSTRKSVPMKKGASIFKEARNTKMIEGRASFQAALEELAMPDADAKGSPIKGASCFLYTEELRSFFVDDAQLIATLTNIYDFHKELKVVLKSGKAVLHNVCVTFLGATNEEYFKEVYTKEAILGGLLARTFIIYEKERRFKDSGMYGKPSDEVIFKKLVHHLKAVTAMKGAFLISDPAKELYNAWYNTIETNKYSTTGVEARIHTGVLKLAMAISVNEGFDKIITIDHMERSIEECIGILHNYKNVVATVVTTPEGNNSRLVLQHLLMSPKYEMSTMELLNALWGTIDKIALDKVIETFLAAGMIDVRTNGSKTHFKLTEKTIDEFKKATLAKATKDGDNKTV